MPISKASKQEQRNKNQKGSKGTNLIYLNWIIVMLIYIILPHFEPLGLPKIVFCLICRKFKNPVPFINPRRLSGSGLFSLTKQVCLGQKKKRFVWIKTSGIKVTVILASGLQWAQKVAFIIYQFCFQLFTYYLTCQGSIRWKCYISLAVLAAKTCF